MTASSGVGLEVGIQADDLTGACDAAAPFAARGLGTVVLLPEAALAAHTAEVLAIDTESRGLPAGEARARARDAAAALAARTPAVLYKKVDSTLRGALVAEIGGVLEATGRPHVVLAPAFPRQRRIVIDGVLHVDGRPADLTPLARDGQFPRTGASVLALLGAGGPRPAGLVPLATVREGPRAVAARLGRGVASLVCDAETDADLRTLAEAAVDQPVLLAGSAGFATALAAGLPPRSTAPWRLPRPLLVIAGTAHPATHAQVARLEARGVRGTWLDPSERSTATDLAPEVSDAFVAVRTELRESRAADREALVARLGQAARMAVARRSGGHGARPRLTLLLTGGETAVAVCRALGATGLTLAGEVEPGLALGALLDGPFAGLPVVTKAGGFGDADTLLRVREACA